MRDKAYIFGLALVAMTSIGAITWVIYEGYQTSIVKAQIAAEAKKFKAAEGNKFKFGFTHDHRLGEQK